MPGRGAHIAIGTGSAAGVGILTSRDLPDVDRLAYVLGAGVGGYIGGVLPDVLEPAIHGHHRDACHSVAMGIAELSLATSAANKIGADMRAQAARLRETRVALSPNDPQRTPLAIREFLIYALLGLVTGVVVGYLSHIIADMTTPRGVPLISRRLI